MPGANTSDWYSLIGKGLDDLSSYFSMKENTTQSVAALPLVQEQAAKTTIMLFAIVVILLIGFFFIRKRI